MTKRFINNRIEYIDDNGNITRIVGTGLDGIEVAPIVADCWDEIDTDALVDPFELVLNG